MNKFRKSASQKVGKIFLFVTSFGRDGLCGLPDYNLLSINLTGFRLASLNCIFWISSAVMYLI